MQFVFDIPTKREDLLIVSGEKYFVKQDYGVNEIPDKLKVAKNAYYSAENVEYIFEHFDTFYSILENTANLTPTILLNTTSLLYISIDRLGKVLSQILQQPNLTIYDRQPLLNATKMLIYLSITNIKNIDKFVKNANDKIFTKKGKKPQTATEVEVLDWDRKRYNALLQLVNIIQLPIENLWDPPIAEEKFVELCTDIAYRTFEHPSIKKIDVSNTVFQILGVAIKKFNHGLIFPVRILQILENCESAVLPIVSGLGILHGEFGITTIFAVLVKELLENLTADNRGENQSSKNIATFFTEIASTDPEMVMPHISTLANEILNLESFTLRNCILQIESDIVIGKLTSEELSEELKETRDDFLEDLCSHLQDISAHVRSKVLQLWENMKTQNAVPLVWQHKILEIAVERLEDKSNMVRKHAISLIKCFLECNPFAAKFSMEELQEKLEFHKSATREISEKLKSENKRMQELDEEWEKLLSEIKPHIEEILEMESYDDFNVTDAHVKDIPKFFGECVDEKKYRELIVAAVKGDEVAGNTEELKSMPLPIRCAYYENLLRSYFLLRNNYQNYEEEYQSAEIKLKFYEDFITFSEILISAIPKLQEMLMSKANSDVFEAIDFFTTGYMFGIKDTEAGMQQILYLMWSKDKEKRDAVSGAYKRIIWKTDQQGRAHTVTVVKNLIKFLRHLTDGHYIAFEELIKEWIGSNDIDTNIIQVLFEVYTLKLENFTDNDARLALQLLIMCSSAKSSIATVNLETLELIGFQERGMKDSRIFSATLSMLMNSIPDQSTNISKYYKRMNADNPSVMKVVDIFKKYFFCPENVDFDDICSKVFAYIYKLSKKPDVLAQEVVIAIYEKLTKISDQLKQNHLNVSEGAGLGRALTQDPQLGTQTQQTNPANSDDKLLLPMIYLTRLIFMIGVVTMRELIYLDIDVYSNLKYRHELKDAEKNAKKQLPTNAPTSAMSARRKTIVSNESATSAKRLSEAPQQQNDDPDEDLIGGSAEDAVAEQITAICEKEMLYSKESMMRKFVPIITEIIKFPQKYKNQELQQASTLALIRIMSVSSVFCEDNIPFLMNLFQYTKNIQIKCNIIIGMSDFTFRFPNVIEPWSNQLYSTLFEENTELRLTTVKILAHLISHEMILVKGQISDLALCLVDQCEEIRVLTEQFFKEISTKSTNILYNTLPDIISRLSDTNLNLEEGKYQQIMKYIMGLINKDRQVESLVEKLCFRFKITVQERQWRDIAYCLSLLSYNEKTLKKLIENVKFFKDKVQVQEVYDSFRIIISNTSKLAKAELKAVIQEFENKLEECLAVNDNVSGNTSKDNNDDDNEERSPNKVVPPKVISKVQKTTGKGKATGKKQAPPARRGRGRQAAVASSDSESDSELENLPPRGKGNKKAPVAATRNTRHQKVIEESSSDEDDQSIKPPSKRGKKP